MKVTYKLINDVFRGKIYGSHDIFTARTFADFVHRHDVDVDRAVNAYDGESIVGTLLYARRKDRAWFSLMGVLPKYRRDGIGRALFVGALDLLVDSGIRSMEFESVLRNAHVRAMYAPFGFRETDRLCVWARKPVKGARGLSRPKKQPLAAVKAIVRTPSTCWQREPISVARANASTLIECDGAYAFIRKRGDHTAILDAGAESARAARELIAILRERVSTDISLVNEPEGSPLSKALARSDWNLIDRQCRMMRTR